MSTLLWLPSSGSAPVSPTPSGTDWGHIAGNSRPLNFLNGGTAMGSTVYTPDAVDDLTNKNSLFCQFVSEVLPPQTIVDQFILQGCVLQEAIATNNLFTAWKIYAVDVPGTSVLGAIVPIQRDSAEANSGALTGSTDSIASITPLVLTVPWRLVVEIGMGGTPTTSASVDGHNGTIRFGEVGEFPQQGDATDGPPYIVFNSDIKRYVYATSGLVGGKGLIR